MSFNIPSNPNHSGILSHCKHGTCITLPVSQQGSAKPQLHTLTVPMPPCPQAGADLMDSVQG